VARRARRDGLLRARDDNSPIGHAEYLGFDELGRAVSRLRIGGEPIEGRWLLVGREFIAAQEGGPLPWR
jgi:hypothetical protein